MTTRIRRKRFREIQREETIDNKREKRQVEQQLDEETIGILISPTDSASAANRHRTEGLEEAIIEANNQNPMSRAEKASLIASFLGGNKKA